MKTTFILGALLVCSATVNVVYYLQSKEYTEDTTCHKTDPFEPYQTIENDQAREFANEYKMSLTDPDKIEGGIITRSALEKILCTENCNAVSFTFARDSVGKTGPEGNGVFVIFSGLNVEYNSSTNTFEYRDLQIDKYITRHWCPPTCNPY